MLKPFIKKTEINPLSFKLHNYLLGSLLIAIVFSFIYLSNLLLFIEQKYWDFLVKFQTNQNLSEQIIVISADSEEWPIPEEKFLELVEKLETIHPAVVAYNFPIASKLTQRLAKTLTPSIYQSQSTPTDSLITPSSLFIDSKSALAITLADSDGVFRKQPLLFNTNSGPEPTFPLAILIALDQSKTKIILENNKIKLGDNTILLDKFFKLAIFFVGSAKSYSYFPISKILSGEITTDQLSGKILFIGPTKPTNARMFTTPTTSAQSLIPETEFLALATNTILNKKELKQFPDTLFIFLLFICLITSSFIFLKLTPLNGLILFTLISLLFTLSGFMVFSKFYYQIPVIHLNISLGFSLITITTLRISNLNSSIRTLLLYLRFHDRGTISLNEQQRGETINDDKWWETIADISSQYLTVQNQLFMEKPPNEKHLKFVCQRGINLSEVIEKRRDITRTPYKFVMDLRSPQVIERFFSDNRLALMVPLVYGTYLMGFWVLLIDKDINFYKRNEKIISLLSNEISTSLITKQQTKELRNNFLFDMFNLERLSLELNSLRELTERLLYERELLSSILDSEADAIAACNLLGKIFIYNTTLVKILDSAKITFNKNNFFETICLLSKFDSNKFRSDLTNIIQKSESTSFAVSISSEETNKFYNLTICSIAPPADSVNQSIRGFIFTLINIKEYKEFDEAKSKLISNITNTSQNFLTPIIGYSELLLESANISEDDKEMVSYVNEQAQKLAKLLYQTSSMADTDIVASQTKYAPINLISLIKEVLNDLYLLTSNNDIKIDFQYPQVIPAIICQRIDIRLSISTFLSFLIEHTSPNQSIFINLIEREKDIVIEMNTTTGGLPTKVIDGLLKNNPFNHAVSESGLLQAKQVFQAHNGLCQIESSLGSGIKIFATISKHMNYE